MAHASSESPEPVPALAKRPRQSPLEGFDRQARPQGSAARCAPGEISNPASDGLCRFVADLFWSASNAREARTCLLPGLDGRAGIKLLSVYLPSDIRATFTPKNWRCRSSPATTKRAAAAALFLARGAGPLWLALDTNTGKTFEVGHRPVHHVDPVDTALPAFEVERARALALPDEMTHRDIVGLTVGVDHFEVQHFHVRATHVQANGFEAALASADRKRVAIPTEQRNFLAAEFYPGARARRWRWRWRRGGLGQPFHAYDRLPAAEVRHRAIDHFDAIDDPVGAAQIERVGAFAALQYASHRNIIGLTIAVDHAQIEHFDVTTAGVQANGTEATIAPSNTQDVAVHAERDGLTSKIDPIAVSALGQGIARRQSGEHQRRRQCSAYSRLHFCLPNQKHRMRSSMAQHFAAIWAPTWPRRGGRPNGT